MAIAKPALRKAADFRVEMKAQPGQAHRSAAGAMIDYRLQEMTDSAVRAISTVPQNFADKPKFGSPWHYHDCEMQIAVVLAGSVELGYRGDTYARASTGDILFIPGHTMHDVGAPSADYQIAEITFPGTFGTVEAPMPARDHVTPAITLSTRDAVRTTAKTSADTIAKNSGVVEYAYPIAAPYADRYAIFRYVRSRVAPFAPSSHRHTDRYRMTIVVEGFKDVDLGDGSTSRVEVGDLLVTPPDVDVKDLALSDDYAAIEVRLLRG